MWIKQDVYWFRKNISDRTIDNHQQKMPCALEQWQKKKNFPVEVNVKSKMFFLPRVCTALLPSTKNTPSCPTSEIDIGRKNMSREYLCSPFWWWHCHRTKCKIKTATWGSSYLETVVSYWLLLQESNPVTSITYFLKNLHFKSMHNLK